MLLLVLLLFVPLCVNAQPTMVKSREVSSLQVLPCGDPKRRPVIGLDGDEWVDINFDVMGHEYRRIIYKVEHWNADWSERSDLLDSEFMEGFDGNAIDDNEESVATSVLYTHYHLQIPNDDVRLRLSGNYRVWLIDEERDDTLACAGLMVNEGGATVAGTVSGRTDVDINGRHQQLELEVGYGALRVVDAEEELAVFVEQNRRWDTRCRLLSPNTHNRTSIGWTHRRELIFDAGNSCRKFEMLGKHIAGMGVDNISYVAPYEHVTLYTLERPSSYNYDESYGGIFVLRNVRGDADTEGEYRWVHFSIDVERLPAGERAYVVGDLTHGQLLPEYELQWNDDLGLYECAALLKEGYYEYRVVHTNGEGCARTWLTDGDFWETHNEYDVSVYLRERGARYDRLVGQYKLESK